MIHVRNPLKATAFTVFAGEALTPGQLVKFAENTTTGLEPKVVAVAEADMADATVKKGVVNFVPDDSLAVDYILDPTDSSLTLNSGSDGTNAIPSGAQCVMWCDKPVIGFDEHSVDAALAADMSVAREAEIMAFDSDSGLLAVYNSGDGTLDVVAGFVYRNEGPELTVILDQI